MKRTTAKVEPPGFADFRRQMVDKANANEALMDGTTAPVKRIIAGSALVLCNLAGPRHAPGVGFYPVKGTRIGLKSMATNTAIKVTAEAVKVLDREMGVACKQVLGEPDPRH